MSQRGRDLSRGRPLTPEEAAHYNQIRRAVLAEIPPAPTSPAAAGVLAQLRQLREEQGVSLADLEAKTGMTRANLCRLENEGRNVQVRTLERYAQALGCRVVIQVVPEATAAG